MRAPVAGSAGSVWAGAGRTLLRVSVRTGAVLTRAALPSGLELSGLAASPDVTTLYAAAARLNAGGAIVLEYTASTGRRLTQADGGLVACVNPATGRVREQEKITSQAILVAADPAAGQIVVVSQSAGVVSITPPRDCWG